MKLLKTLLVSFLSIFSKNGNNYEPFKIIPCNGFLDETKCSQIFDYLYSDDMRGPVVLGIDSLNGDKYSIQALVQYIEHEYPRKDELITLNCGEIGGYSNELFLSGNRRIFFKESNMYISPIKLSSCEAKAFDYCDEII